MADFLMLFILILGLLVMLQIVRGRTAFFMVILSASIFALYPIFVGKLDIVPYWVLVLLILWVAYTVVRALAGLILGRNVADNLLANILTLMLIDPINAFVTMVRSLFRRR